MVTVFYFMNSHTVPPEVIYSEDANPPNLKGTIFIEGAVKSLKYI